MHRQLPTIDDLRTLPSSVWSQLREKLQAAGFAEQYNQNVRRAAIGANADGLQRPLVLWHLRRRSDVAACAFRMCVLGDAVAITDAQQLLGCPLLDTLLNAGMLIQPDPTTVVSVFDLRVFKGLLLLCDDLSHKGDAVYGAGYGTAAFCDLFPRSRPVHHALDVGCGAGAVALWISAGAERVVASDINPRALAFVKINAALNGITNVEVREGSLFESVVGERFDVITSQLPYVPRAPGTDAATYLFAGPNGNELVSRLLGEIKNHLTTGGRAMVVFEQSVAASIESQAPDCDVQLDPGTRSLFIVGEPVEADAYTLRHAAPELRRGIEAFDTAVTQMREHLHAVGIRALSPAVAIIEHAPDSRGWVATLPAGNNLWNEISTEMIERLLASQTLLRKPANGHVEACVHIPEGSLYVQPLTQVETGMEKIYLGLPPGYLVPSLELSREEWQVLKANDGRATPEPLPQELIAKAAHAGLIRDPSSADT